MRMVTMKISKFLKPAIVRSILTVWIIASTPAEAIGDDVLLQAAQAAAEEGRLMDMQAAYERILLSDQKNVRALLGKATSLSWQGQYSDAQEVYLDALAIDSKNLDGWTGLGYAYAWNQEYSKAHTAFRRALHVDPRNVGARKGIAYSYHWAGEHQLALESFEIAESIANDDAEIAEAAGRVKLSLGRSKDALADFDRALQLQPDRDSARFARRSANTSAPALALSVRAGSTSDAGSGLRSIEVAHWSSPTTRFAARYDNSLTLDNSFLARLDDDNPGYYVSVQQTFSERWLARIEVGMRRQPSDDEDIVGIQGAYSTRNGVARAGAQLSRHRQGYNDTQLFGGFNFPLGHRWRLEPTVYLSTSGPNDDREWRAVMHAEYRPESYWQVGGFAGAGTIDAEATAFDGSTTVAGLWGSVLIADRHSVHFTVRWEEAPTVRFTVAELGFTYRLPGN